MVTGGTGNKRGDGQDGQGNIDVFASEESYGVWANILKITKTESRSLRAGLDQSLSWSFTTNNFINGFNAQGFVALLSANGNGRSENNDSWGNITKGIVILTFRIIAGQARNTNP